MTERDFTTIRWEQRGAVGWVTLDRPQRHNAFDRQMCDELQSLWRDLRNDSSVRCVVLTATGDSAFCSGIDRDFVPAGNDADAAYSPLAYDDIGEQLGPRANGLWTPVIAAVNGLACGGAFYLLAEVDFLIAADHATFFDPHVTYGMPAVFEPMLMSHRMPMGEILRLTLLGNHERMSARRACEIGLVSEVCPADELEARATWAAEAVASAPAEAVQATVRAIWAAKELSRKQALELGPALLNLGMSSQALAEGQEAFRSKARITPRIR